MKNFEISQEQILSVLQQCYDKSVNGLPNTKSCLQLAEEYINKYKSPEESAKKFIKWQIAKCSASGFITSLGGLITLPIAVPANVVSVLYVQLRMIATLAVIGGYDVSSDEVETLVYLCLVNSSISEICRNTGIQIANKTTTSLLKKLPGKVLTKINQAVGFRLVTKFGEKGVINLVKIVPVAGGLIGAGVDFANTKVVAKKAYNAFIENKID